MHKTSIIQYLPLTRPKATRRLIKKLDLSGIMSILDLEDSAQDPFDMVKTQQLKEEARHGLVSISNKYNWNITSKIFVRLNATDTEYFEKDVEAVIKASQNMPISGVFIPKVEHYSQVKLVESLLSIADIKINIVLMVETVKGMKNISKILEEDVTNNRFKYVHYGHFDYCLNADIWPFTDPRHAIFWKDVRYLAELSIRYDKTYIHTPFPFPKDVQLFWASNIYIMKLFSQDDVWISTLNAELSLSNKPDKSIALDFIEIDLSKKNLVKDAKNICYDFLNGRANKRSFSLSKDKFIPPHQFFAAKKFLENSKRYE